MGLALFTLGYYFLFGQFFSRLLLAEAGALSFIFTAIWHLAFDQWQRRILRRNEHVHAVETQPLATGEQYALFSRYVLARHRDGDMADMDFDDYRAMVEESPVDTAIVEFHDDSAEGRLVGACLVDWLSSGVSAVYSYFDTQDPRRGRTSARPAPVQTVRVAGDYFGATTRISKVPGMTLG